MLHYCIFIETFLEVSGELQVRHVSEGRVKLLAGNPVHLCAPAAAPCAVQTSMKRLSFVGIILPQGRAGMRPWAHLSPVCTRILEVNV